MAIKPKSGFAVIEHGDILIWTVSESARSAISKWLVTRGKTMPQLAGMADKEFYACWAGTLEEFDRGALMCTTIAVELRPSGLAG